MPPSPPRIAYLTAGAAGMYCGSCMHDNTLAAAMIRDGHDVSLIPTYTPIRTDEHDVSTGQVFYGAINVYLEQKSALFRHTPWLVDRLLAHRRLLGWASRRNVAAPLPPLPVPPDVARLSPVELDPRVVMLASLVTLRSALAPPMLKRPGAPGPP